MQAAGNLSVPLLLLLAAACWNHRDPVSTSEFRLHGAVGVTARGGAEAGLAGTPEESYYAISLGGPDGVAAAVFTRAGAVPPPVGVYRMGEDELGSDGFSGLLIVGMPAHPSAVFRVRSGTLTVTAATPEQLSGRFELQAVGFLTDSPTRDRTEVTAEGSFTASRTDRDTTDHRQGGRSR
jgi:hypothetical protein